MAIVAEHRHRHSIHLRHAAARVGGHREHWIHTCKEVMVEGGHPDPHHQMLST